MVARRIVKYRGTVGAVVAACRADRASLLIRLGIPTFKDGTIPPECCGTRHYVGTVWKLFHAGHPTHPQRLYVVCPECMTECRVADYAAHAEREHRSAPMDAYCPACPAKLISWYKIGRSRAQGVCPRCGGQFEARIRNGKVGKPAPVARAT
jgi:hypothetical protein